MTVILDLKKNAGLVLDLSKNNQNFKILKMVVTWKMHPVHGKSLSAGFDLDLAAFFLTDFKKVEGLEDILFFNNKTVYGGAGLLAADERAGGSEEVVFDLTKVPANRSQIDHYVSVYEAVKRNQTFLSMTDAKVALVDGETGDVIQEYALNDFTNDNALHVGSTVRENGKWQFYPVGKSAAVQDLNEIAGFYA